jgi:hypothetical protein
LNKAGQLIRKNGHDGWLGIADRPVEVRLGRVSAIAPAKTVHQHFFSRIVMRCDILGSHTRPLY